MPAIKLTDQVGLSLDAQLASASALLKYAQQLPSLRLDGFDLAKVGGMTLDQPALRSLRSGVSFQEPLQLAEGGAKLSVSAGVHGMFRIGADPAALPGGDVPGERPPDACYTVFEVDATAAAGGSGAAAELHFGASLSSELIIQNYYSFPFKTGVTLLDALRQSVAGFSLPMSAGDLENLAAGQIVCVAVSGKLSLSGSADLFATVNALASVKLPAPLPMAAVSGGGSATVSAACNIEAEYDVVVRKLTSGAVQLGWYRKGATEVNVRAEVSEGLSATLGNNDLFSQVVQAISADPQADLKELASAAVPPEQASQIRDAVKAATSRKLEIAVAAAFTAGDSHTATFLFEIEPGELTEASRNAVRAALRGNLSGLHAPALPGVTCLRSVWDDVRKRSFELDVNLLGILNYRSVTSLSLDGNVLYEPTTGSLVITDKATAQRIRSTQINYGADSQKLRHVLAESFFLTAAYRGAKEVPGALSLRCSHVFFELEKSATRNVITRHLRTGVALRLLSSAEAELPDGVAEFGRTLFSASADYDEELVSGFFLDANGTPLPRERYETAGRNAVQFLVQPDDIDAVRLRPAIDDDLWQRMKQTGQPGFPALFPGVPAPLVGAITTDYTAIQWWAGAMCSAAQELLKVREFLARNPKISFQDPDFQKVREALSARLCKVAANTHEEFGRPWGLIAMSQLASQRAGASISITGPVLVRSKRRALAAATGS